MKNKNHVFNLVVKWFESYIFQEDSSLVLFCCRFLRGMAPLFCCCCCWLFGGTRTLKACWYTRRDDPVDPVDPDRWGFCKGAWIRKQGSQTDSPFQLAKQIISPRYQNKHNTKKSSGRGLLAGVRPAQGDLLRAPPGPLPHPSCWSIGQQRLWVLFA